MLEVKKTQEHHHETDEGDEGDDEKDESSCS